MGHAFAGGAMAMTDGIQGAGDRLARWFVLGGCGLWFLTWISGAAAYAFFGKYETPLILGIFTIPVYPALNAVIGWSNRPHNVTIGFVVLLVAGLLQYGVIGYFMGKLVSVLRMEFSRR